MDCFTIGHSNQTIEAFVSLLQKHEVTAVADVRSSPYSRYLPHFNQVALKQALSDEGIRYVFLGQELGARSKDPDCYDVDGKAVYERIAQTDRFQKGIQRVLEGAQKYRIALMCAEKDPITCHRAILVSRFLQERDLNIQHILKNGDLESHQCLENRLLIKQGFTNFSEASNQAQLTLFSADLPNRTDCLVKAYRLQGDEIAYVEKRNDDHDQTTQSVHHWVHSKERADVL